jgi:hypothetical protein
MNRTILWVPLGVAGFALACLYRHADAQPAPAPPPAPAQSVRLTLAIKAGNDVRTHELVISDRGCGVVKEKSPQYEDDVRICSVPTANGIAIEIEGFVRAGSTEYRQKSEVIVARKGASFEVGRTNGMRFAVKTL